MYQTMIGFIGLYGREVFALKKHYAAAEMLAERLELPEDALLGAARVTVTGGKTLLVENHRGILEYGTERLRIAVLGGQLAISGSALSLAAMNGEELLVRGKIITVEWE